MSQSQPALDPFSAKVLRRIIGRWRKGQVQIECAAQLMRRGLLLGFTPREVDSLRRAGMLSVTDEIILAGGATALDVRDKVRP